MITINNNFLAINKDYFGKGMKPIDLLILSQIEEFIRNNHDCYMTDEYFMYITGAKISAVRASLDRLEDKNIIIRDTKTVTGNGKANKQRTISLRKNYRDAILKNNACCVENQYIKDNLKDNKNIILEGTSPSKAKIQSTIRYY